MSIVITKHISWTANKWVSMKFFHDAIKFVNPDTGLGKELLFLEKVSIDTLNMTKLEASDMDELGKVVIRVIEYNNATLGKDMAVPEHFKMYYDKIIELSSMLKERGPGSSESSVKTKLQSEVKDYLNFNKSANALIEMTVVDEAEAGRLSLEILEKKQGDSYLQAVAFSVLYSIQKLTALSVVEKELTRPDAILLEKMLEEIAEDFSGIKNTPQFKKMQSDFKIYMHDNFEKINDSLKERLVKLSEVK
jgi:hypothetical protein